MCANSIVDSTIEQSPVYPYIPYIYIYIYLHSLGPHLLCDKPNYPDYDPIRI